MPPDARLIAQFHFGERAYENGEPITANPNNKRSDLHTAWEAGWNHAEHDNRSIDDAAGVA